MSSYQKALKGLYSLDKFGSQLGLERIRHLLEALGHPERKYKCVVVGGSNGKGSTVEMLGSILQQAGFKVGTYFSPQIEEFPERIRVNGKNASNEEIAEAYYKVADVCAKRSIQATFFEVATAMALCVFEKQGVDFAVLEVGLGGRLDATNAVEPSVSCIASISLEHTHILGDTEEKIALEKCGIARKGKPLVVGQVNGIVKKTIESRCAEILAKPIFVSESAEVSSIKKSGFNYSFKVKTKKESYSVFLGAPGRFQINNALVALLAAEALGVKKAAIEKGLALAVPKYRFELISRSPKVFADCCHNPGAAFALVSELRQLRGKKVLLFSAMADKDYARVLDILGPFFGKVVLTQTSLPRAARLGDLKAAASHHSLPFVAVKKPSLALKEAKRLAGKNGTVVIAGSIYLLGELFGKDKIRIAQ
ncbi:MAG: bifunctional folylpolyglutamate synthase/dihydrofolate synthase [Candidatus Micrarchaeota archaeon]|nr:bifunctional folylpolyglutamate synthase/dihydrofolate synthase [Candidatus Micrarchaeota archaeon]